MATSRILGPDGQPITIADIEEPQTSRLLHLQRELQSHPSRGLTPSRIARILDQAEQGDITAQYELFADMEEKDGHIASEMGKRRRACIVSWEVVPPRNPSPAEKRNAEQLAELLAEVPDFEDVVFDATDAIGNGFACLEIEWHQLAGSWVPKTITHRPQTWFTLHRGYRQELRLRTNTTTDGVPGEALRSCSWITHVHKARSGTLERTALFRQLVWTYLFKNYSVGDLAEFLEIYGIPLRIGKFPASATEKEKLTLLRAIAGIGHNAAGIIPDGMLLEFHNAATGDPAAFELMISWCERNQSKVILGGTLTSGADGKSSTNALGNVHNEVRKDLRDGDLRQLNSTLTRDLIYPMAALNGLAPDGLRRCPALRLHVQESTDMAAYAEALTMLVPLGVRPTVQWTHEKLGIPQAENGQATLMPPATSSAAPSTPPNPALLAGAALAAATAQLGGAVPQPPAAPGMARPTPPQAMAHQLDSLLAPVVTGMVDKIRALATSAQSLQELRDGLDALLPGMTLDQYAAAMATALTAARLAGRYEVLQESAGPHA